MSILWRRLPQEEIFGPVLAVIKAKNFDEAMEIANNTEFGLTGAVYSKNRKQLEKAEREFFVGQPVLQPEVHRRNGGGASVRRIQYERDGFKGRRPGLPAPLPAGKVDCGKESRTVMFQRRSPWQTDRHESP